MPPDFTLAAYSLLIEALLKRDFMFFRLDEFLSDKPGRGIILRHDVDSMPGNSLVFARIQNQHGIRGSYYFNANPSAKEALIIKEIHELGHETGYHYNTMESCDGDHERAWDEFRRNLDTLRKLVPVNTITMHGSPLSCFDNRNLWQRYDYHTLGILGEPYIDIDFSEVAYLTDTGRKWNGNRISVRDKVKDSFNLNFSTTFDIIANTASLPDRLLFTFHPQRWSDNPFNWTAEFCFQNVKNLVKYLIISYDFMRNYDPLIKESYERS